METTQFEERPTSLGGYGSIVPYHGVVGYDGSRGQRGHTVWIPTDSTSDSGEVLELLTRAADLLDVSTERGKLFYSVQCMDFSWYGSGREQLEDDLEDPWSLAESVRSTMESQHNTDLDIHRPCFAIVAPARFGLFFVLLRGAKDSSVDDAEYKPVHYTKAGVLMENPVMAWDGLEEIIDSQEAIPLEETHVEITSLGGDNHPLERVVPVDHERTGDADLVAAESAYSSSGKEASEELRESIDRTQRLTYRIKGGTVGFEKESEYRAQSMSLINPDMISLWGAPFVIGRPMCSAHSE